MLCLVCGHCAQTRRTPGTAGVSLVRYPDADEASCATETSYSRWTDHSIHLCSKTPHACFHARGSSVRRPLAKALIPCTMTPGELVICGLAPLPDGASLPRADARVLA